MPHLFVYGTLRQNKDSPSHHINGFAMYKYDGRHFSFPYILQEPGHRVYGELHEVTEDNLKELDFYEGVGRGLYERKAVNVYSNTNPDIVVEAFVYVQKSLHPQRITSGDWFVR